MNEADPPGGKKNKDRRIALGDPDGRVAKLLLGLTDVRPVQPHKADADCSQPAATTDRRALVEAARRALQDRRRRASYFHAAMFSEPAWELLLTLYIDRCEMTFEQAAISIDVSQKPARRWIDYLEALRFVRLVSKPGPELMVQLTAEGESTLDAYLSDIITA